MPVGFQAGLRPVDWVLSGASVDLDFANNRFFPGGSVTSYLSITRASIGYAETSTGMLTSFASNALRITNRGLLIEDAQINYVLNSADFSTWTNAVNGATVTTDTTNAPDGTTTGDTIVFANTDYRYASSDAMPSSASLSVTISIWLQGSGTIVLRFIDTNVGDFKQVLALNSSWTRYSLSAVADTSLGTHKLVFGLDNRVLQGASGAAVTLQAWGAQIETAAFASSYIPTTGTSATRAADSVTTIGSLETVLATLPMSVMMDVFAINAGQVSNGAPKILSDQGGSGGASHLYMPAANNAVGTADGIHVPLTTATFPGGILYTTGAKVATGQSSGGRSLVGGGGTVATDANFLTLVGPGQIGSASFPFAYFRRLTAWNSRLADATLQALTT